MVVLEIQQSSEFDQQLQQAGTKVVFVDFYAQWCGPCTAIAPKFADMSDRYSHAVFLKIDVDELEDIAARFGVSAMPTFICFKNRAKVEEKKGKAFRCINFT